MSRAESLKKKNFTDIRSSIDDPLRNALSIAARADKVLADLDRDPMMFDGVLNLVSNGMSLINISDKLGVPYNRLSVWLNNTSERRERVSAAVTARNEYIVARILDEVQGIGLSNMKHLLNEDGTMKALKDLPDAVTACISSFEVEEKEIGDIRIGTIKKVKMIDKIRGLEVLIKGLQGFVEHKELKVEHTFTVQAFDLEERIKMLNNAKPKEVIDAVNVRPVNANQSQDL